MLMTHSHAEVFVSEQSRQVGNIGPFHYQQTGRRASEVMQDRQLRTERTPRGQTGILAVAGESEACRSVGRNRHDHAVHSIASSACLITFSIESRQIA